MWCIFFDVAGDYLTDSREVELLLTKLSTMVKSWRSHCGWWLAVNCSAQVWDMCLTYTCCMLTFSSTGPSLCTRTFEREREGHVKRFLSTRPMQQEYLAEEDPRINGQSIDEYCKSLLRFRVIGETPSRCSC